MRRRHSRPSPLSPVTLHGASVMRLTKVVTLARFSADATDTLDRRNGSSILAESYRWVLAKTILVVWCVASVVVSVGQFSVFAIAQPPSQKKEGPPMSAEDTDSDADRTTGTPDPSDVLGSQRTPVIDEKLTILVLTKYHRSKGVLEDNEEAQITRFQLEEDFEAADTALSDIYVLKVTYQLPTEQSERSLELIVKQLPQDPFARFFVKEAQFDLREIKFYTKVEGFSGNRKFGTRGTKFGNFLKILIIKKNYLI